LALYAVGDAPKSDDMPWLTWAESAQQLMKVVLSDAGLQTPDDDHDRSLA
jgi:hypothetical protein